MSLPNLCFSWILAAQDLACFQEPGLVTWFINKQNFCRDQKIQKDPRESWLRVVIPVPSLVPEVLGWILHGCMGSLMCDQWAPFREGNCRSCGPDPFVTHSSLTWMFWVFFWIQDSPSSGQRKGPVRKDDSRCVCMQASWHQSLAGRAYAFNTYNCVSYIGSKS